MKSRKPQPKSKQSPQDQPLSPQEIALRQAAESRARRGAAEPEPSADEGEPAA